jgi:excisionase family DNA binding protein
MEPLLTINEAASLLKIHPVTLRNWLRTGKIRGVKQGEHARAHLKLEPCEVALWIKQNTRG